MPRRSYFQRILGVGQGPGVLAPPRLLFRPAALPIEPAEAGSPRIPTRAAAVPPVAEPGSPAAEAAPGPPRPVHPARDDSMDQPGKLTAEPVLTGATRPPELPASGSTRRPSPTTSPRPAGPAFLVENSPGAETPETEPMRAGPPADPTRTPPAWTAVSVTAEGQGLPPRPIPPAIAAPATRPVSPSPNRGEPQAPIEARFRGHRVDETAKTSAGAKTGVMDRPRAIEPEMPPIRLEPSTIAPRTRPVNTEDGRRPAVVRIGSLEVRIVPPESGTGPAVPAAAAVDSPPARPAPSRPSTTRLARGFGSFGLAQG